MWSADYDMVAGRMLRSLYTDQFYGVATNPFVLYLPCCWTGRPLCQRAACLACSHELQHRSCGPTSIVVYL
jgi:hypothetical protein